MKYLLFLISSRQMEHSTVAPIFCVSIFLLGCRFVRFGQIDPGLGRLVVKFGWDAWKNAGV